MIVSDNNRYESLQKTSSGMSPWIFYPVMLLSSLFIFFSVAYYIRSLKSDHFPFYIEKDTNRAKLYSLLTYNNEDTFSQTPEMVIRATLNVGTSDTKKIVCYYNIPANNDSKDLRPSEIHADLCTHINIAFAGIENKIIKLDKQLIRIIGDVVDIKKKNNNLKVILSIGGAGNNIGFSEMVVDHASRKTFIRSIKSILKKYKLDGVDLDWEFPGLRDGFNIRHRERQHFSQLLREIRAEYTREKQDYLLTIAAAAPQAIVDISYDVDQINMYVDYVNIMSYDFHFYTTYTPFTGLNSPLYSRPQEKFYLSTLNINSTVHMYLSKGLEPNKIVVGVPTYGHSYTIVNKNNGDIGSPALGYGKAGSGSGFVNYPEICAFFDNDSSNSTIIKYDKYARVPYLKSGTEWISYDDRISVMEKANFIKDNNLGGAMIYSLNADDFSGMCLLKGIHIKFPLSQSLKKVLHDNT